MLSISDVVFGLGCYVLIGFLPVYVVSRSYLDSRSSIVAALGFAPVLIGLINLLVVGLKLEESFFQYLVIAFILGCIYVLKKKYLAEDREAGKTSNLLWIFLLSILFGLAYWLMAFPIQLGESVSLNFDVTWNLGFVSELKHHFPPIDPHWYTDRVFVYHHLSTLYQAGLSNFTSLDILTTLHLTNLFTSLSVFFIVALFFRGVSALESLLIFSMLIITSFADDWTVFRAFHGHITGLAASTFFWSIPMFLSGLYIWFILDKNRDQINLVCLGVIVLVFSAIEYFSKGSYITVFLFLELFSFGKIFVTKRLWLLTNVRKYLRTIVSYSFFPVSFFLLTFLNNAQNQIPIIVGLEIRDFTHFNSWNPVYPVTAIYSITAVFMACNFRNVRSMKWEILVASFLNFVLFFVLKHPGYSDLYFIFNAILLNIIFIIGITSASRIVSWLVTYFICGFAFWYVTVENHVQGFNTIRLSLDEIYQQSNSNESLDLREIEEYMALSDSLPVQALIAAPNHYNRRFFLYSAFLGRRIWNESPIYGQGVINDYLPERLFMKQEGFLPDYFEEKPDQVQFDQALSEYKSTHSLDQSNLEDPADRYIEYDSAVFLELPLPEAEQIAERNKWTHIIVEKSEVVRISEWMKTLRRIEGTRIIIFECASNSVF